MQAGIAVSPIGLLESPPGKRSSKERLLGNFDLGHARQVAAQPVNLRPVQLHWVGVETNEEFMAFAVQASPVLAHVLVRKPRDTSHAGSLASRPRAQVAFLRRSQVPSR